MYLSIIRIVSLIRFDRNQLAIGKARVGQMTTTAIERLPQLPQGTVKHRTEQIQPKLDQVCIDFNSPKVSTVMHPTRRVKAHNVCAVIDFR